MKRTITKRQNKSGTVYRIIIKYIDEYDNPAVKEATYKPEPGASEARAQVFAELYSEKIMDNLAKEIEQKKLDIELERKSGGKSAKMTFADLAKEWLEFKYDENNPANSNNISVRYYKKAIGAIEEYNKEFGKMRLKDITHEVVYRYYKKLSKEKKVRIICVPKPDLKEIIAYYKLSYRKILANCKNNSLSLNSIYKGKNVTDRTAKRFCEVTGIPFNDAFTKQIIEEDYSDYTIWDKKKLLKAIFSFGKEVLRIIDDNPAIDRLSKSMRATRKRESLSEEQAIKFYEATKEFEIMIQTAMHMSLLTGMRPAEMGGLEWRDIDFSYKTITIERNAIDAPEFGVILKGTKTNTARTISIPDILVEQLLKYRKWQEEWKEELGDYYKDEGQVFSTAEGKRITTHVFGKWFKKVRAAACLPENFTLYNLRHTNLSILVGYVPITTVAQRAGHSTIKTTEEYYIHRVSEADMLASQKLNNVFADSYKHQENTEAQNEIEEYKKALEKMKQLGFKTLQEYFEYLNYMKSKGYKY